MPFNHDKFESLAKEHKRISPLALFVCTPSGVRAQGSRLDSVAFRLGIVAAVRSKYMQGKSVGVMITASANFPDENGVKIIDSDGSTLDCKWQSICTEITGLANHLLADYVRGLIETYEVKGNCLVFVAMDNRKTSPKLAKSAIDGARALDAEVRDFGLLTTPQLHYIVYSFNKGVDNPTEDGYYDKLSRAFKDLCTSLKGVPTSYDPILHLDCTYGVGSISTRKLLPMLEPFLQVKIFCDNNPNLINGESGIVHVESRRDVPSTIEVSEHQLWASLDGDADRIIFYYLHSEYDLRLLNGDKIAALFCLYIKELLQSLELVDQLTFQVVLTAYSNAKAIEYFKNVLKVHVECSPVRVKNLLEKAQLCDISVWFETNGHGSVKYNEKAYEMVKEKMKTDSTGSAKILLSIFNLMNQATSDSICNFLLVEAILRAKDWDAKVWDSLFTSNPFIATTVTVADPYFIKTNDNATEILEPLALKAEIDDMIAKYGEGSRVVVRSSETLPHIRIYTEASTRNKAGEMLMKTQEIIRRYSVM